jgi:hypothetical protein
LAQRTEQASLVFTPVHDDAFTSSLEGIPEMHKLPSHVGRVPSNIPDALQAKVPGEPWIVKPLAQDTKHS